MASGFVYIWYDKKHKRFYIGSHWGPENDGYICSSTWMRQAYKHRPQDFKRRILVKINSTRRDLLFEEQRWLYMIRERQLGKRYYNLCKGGTGHWSSNPEKYLSTLQKSSAALKHKWATDPTVRANHKKAHWAYNIEKRKNITEIIKKAQKGRKHTAEHIEKRCAKYRGKKRRPNWKYRGEQCKGAKLTEEIVRMILNSKESSLKLAPKLNISSSVIRHIRQGRSWKHLQLTTPKL